MTTTNLKAAIGSGIMLMLLCLFWFQCCTSGIAGVGKEDLKKINEWRWENGLPSLTPDTAGKR